MIRCPVRVTRAGMALLGDLDTVPWERLHHAYGPATDVPGLLCALADPGDAVPGIVRAAEKNNRSVFDHVTWELWGNVFHQGSVWQVTAKVVPFLVEILADGPEDVETKRFLVRYLHSLALGYHDDLFPDLPNPDEEFASVAGMTDPDEEPDYSDDVRPLIWMRDSYDAVERSLEAIVPYVDANDDQLAEAAIALAASFPRRRDLTLAPLTSAARAGGRRGATAALSLAVLGVIDAPDLSRALLQSDDPLTAAMGAGAFVLTGQEPTPDVIAALAAPDRDTLDRELAHVPTLGVLTGRCLQRLGPEYREVTTGQIRAQLESAAPMEALSLTQSLLSIAFADAPPPEKAADLSQLQRRALEAVRDHGPFRVAGGDFGNYALLMSGWGLPADHEALAKWLRPGWFSGLFGR